MQVVSVNVGEKRSLQVGKSEKITGIYKASVDHPVEVKRLGITGDQVVDKRHHGGPDQALYLYRTEDYEYWAAQLERELPPGSFGENLTVSGLPGPALGIGDRLISEGLELEITAPRIPCSVFAARIGDVNFVKKFIQAERPGFYARVIKVGLVEEGQKFELLPNDNSMSTVQLYQALQGKLAPQIVAQMLELPLAERARADLTKQLDRS